MLGKGPFLTFPAFSSLIVFPLYGPTTGIQLMAAKLLGKLSAMMVDDLGPIYLDTLQY